MSEVNLTSESIEAIAGRVAELLRGEPGEGTTTFLTASEVAERLNVSRDYVYEHAAELGAKPLSSGPKARLRFDLDQVVAALGPKPFNPPTEAPSRRRQQRRPSDVELLPVGRPK